VIKFRGGAGGVLFVIEKNEEDEEIREVIN
jgi:hypothetical protein